MTEHRHWERFTRAQRLARFTVYLGTVALLVVSLKTVEVIPDFLFDAPKQVGDLLRRMWPVDFGAYFKQDIHTALIETLNTSTLGTIVALIMAAPLGVMAAKNIVPFGFLNWIAKFILVASRTVNTLVWAILFVAVFGPGALAGTAAIACRSVGFCGKLLGETLEEIKPGPIEALKAAGAPWTSILIKGYWPQVAPAFWGISLFRWDINVRESAVIGLVGAGGIGVSLENALNLFRWTQVSLVLLCIFAVVVLAELFVTKIREKMI
uniref:Phosphonate ABC transporter, permease protein PhnE n=1 Tax=Fundidesulfovibrio putealis TaxID=270496 RepID=A0A7C4EIS6_9BACT